MRVFRGTGFQYIDISKLSLRDKYLHTVAQSVKAKVDLFTLWICSGDFFVDHIKTLLSKWIIGMP